MGAAFNSMTAEEIRRRLTSLAEQEEAFASRDLDAELAETMRAGGDIDALESAQLEAERTARRHRAERAALETELPKAVAREGDDQIAGLLDQHIALRKDVPAHIDRIETAWTEFLAAVRAWGSIQERAEQITRQAAQVASDSGATMPDLGVFGSVRVIEVAKDINRNEAEFKGRLASAERSAHTIQGLHRYVVD